VLTDCERLLLVGLILQMTIIREPPVRLGSRILVNFELRYETNCPFF
jgi:hypothetical protein